MASRCLVLVDDVRDGVFEGDESRHQIGWYEVSCTLLLISLLAWVLERLNARLPLMLLVACWFVRPLSMSECFYCRSFLWHLSHFSLFHSWSGGLVWVRRFIPNHGQAQLIFILSCKMLVDTFPREYNKFALQVVVHNFCSFPLC